ncbi:uncharacterized protein LOC126820928 [Patella vulgata]|uniref:uncharacterized protein LOC126820928 n=1 Tax=Patella vulgata TaxID=6465 RepID=UPI0024A7D109|nr:uncharacterized protein LOC126820928 [Patella vulgata]
MEYLAGMLIVFHVTVLSGQSMEVDMKNDVALYNGTIVLASLVISIIACVGVLSLITFLFCYMRNKRKRPIKKLSSKLNYLASLKEQHSNNFTELLDQDTQLSMVPLEPVNICVGVGTLRQVSLTLLQDSIINLYNIRVKLDSRNETFRSDDELAMTTASDNEAVQRQLRKRLQFIFKDDSTNIETFSSIGDDILTGSTVRQLLDATFRICRVGRGIIREWKVENEIFVGTMPVEATGYINFTVEDNVNKIKLTWDDHKFSEDFLNTISMMLQALRDERRQPTPVEYLAIHLAYHCMASGKQVTLEGHRSLGSPGFRPHTQTYMSLTDPGDGHVLGTTRFNEWMLGAIVHVEHLERPGNLSREHIESYRVPSLYDFSRVRLHVGSAAPNTYFVGRRMKDSGSFDEDFLKLVHMTSATASAAFYQGAAECKVAMEGLTTSQAVRYMRALRAQVHRDRFSQFLSAAWNINQVVVDDFEDENPTQLTDKMDIAIRAIEITCLGGFEKITWDGASDTYPSKCIMDQLTFQEALFLVHEAHSNGLLTYFSAGFKLPQIKQAVLTGVDGIGIGGAQVLRFMDYQTGMHGPYMEENIPGILEERDMASQTIRGRGVYLLSRLNTMYFEGSISSTENGMRCKLFNALLQQDEVSIDCVLGKLGSIMSIPCEYSFPLFGSAKRIALSKNPLLKEVAESSYEWALFVSRLKVLISKCEENGIQEEYNGEPWRTFRKKYRDNVNGDIRFKRQTSQTVQYKTQL